MVSGCVNGSGLGLVVGLELWRRITEWISDLKILLTGVKRDLTSESSF